MAIILKFFMKARFVILLILFTECASEKPINTYTRTPEITIPDISKKQAKEALIDQMNLRDFFVRSVHDFPQSTPCLTIYFVRIMDDAGTQFFQNYDQDVPLEYRVAFKLFETDSGIRIVLSFYRFTNSSYSSVIVHGFSRSDEKDYWQELFIDLANSF